MSDKLFFDVLTTEEVWLRQNAPEMLREMRAMEKARLTQQGNPKRLAEWNARQARCDKAWETHREILPRIKLWNEPPLANNSSRHNCKDESEGEGASRRAAQVRSRRSQKRHPQTSTTKARA